MDCFISKGEYAVQPCLNDRFEDRRLFFAAICIANKGVRQPLEGKCAWTGGCLVLDLLI